jgi:hypothetical protein
MRIFNPSNLIALLAIFVSGCTSVQHESISGQFSGLRATTESNSTVCILFVHGMGGYTTGDPDNLVAAIKGAFNLHPVPGGTSDEIYPSTPSDPASLKRQVFSNDAGEELRMYTLSWEPIADAIKSQYLGYDADSPTAKSRLSLDQAARQDFMYGRVTDVVVYAGAGREKIQGSVKNALKIMHRDVEGSDGAKKKYRYFIVTWSLGSKIVFDCLSKPVAATQPATAGELDTQTALTSIARRTDSVFMLANQLPLLAMVDAKPTTNPVESKATAEGIEGFVKHRNAARTAVDSPPRRLSVVAVSDPNDLLSYPIPDWMAQRVPDAYFTNVSISVAHTALYVPFLFGGGWTINPATAHTAYGSDKEVIHLIIEGGTAK